MPTIVQCRGGPVVAGSTPQYTAGLFDASGNPVAGSNLTTFTLTIVDTLTGAIINGVSGVNILNTGRGTVDDLGNVTVNLLSGDTALDYPTLDLVSRSLIFWYSYNNGATVGAHQADFQIVSLAGGLLSP